jgi:hypothetical protein
MNFANETNNVNRIGLNFVRNCVASIVIFGHVLVFLIAWL